VIAHLYDGLAIIAPSIGALLGRAAALAQMDNAEGALAAIDDIPAASVATHQPYWALRAHLLQRLGRVNEAKPAYERAIGLTEDPAVRDFLLGRMEAGSIGRSER
jgi:RNA polymerase sigma-70 factor, ECF subfamily